MQLDISSLVMEQLYPAWIFTLSWFSSTEILFYFTTHATTHSQWLPWLQVARRSPKF